MHYSLPHRQQFTYSQALILCESKTCKKYETVSHLYTVISGLSVTTGMPTFSLCRFAFNCFPVKVVFPRLELHYGHDLNVHMVVHSLLKSRHIESSMIAILRLIVTLMCKIVFLIMLT